MSTYLGGLVFRRGYEEGAVSTELDVVDLVVEFMDLNILELIPGLLKPVLVLQSYFPQ